MDEPVVRHPGEGEVLFDGERGSSRIKVARHELLLSETSLTSGARGAAPHIHRKHADAFYVLEGEVEFHVGDEVVSAAPDTYVLAPPHVV